jgi:hypothetical protein
MILAPDTSASEQRFYRATLFGLLAEQLRGANPTAANFHK